MPIHPVHAPPPPLPLGHGCLDTRTESPPPWEVNHTTTRAITHDAASSVYVRISHDFLPQKCFLAQGFKIVIFAKKTFVCLTTESPQSPSSPVGSGHCVPKTI